MRYTGPKDKLSRRLGVSIFTDDWKNNPTPPGAAGKSMKKGRRGNATAFSEQFKAKQIVKKTYGMSEKQFRRFFKIAENDRGNRGAKFLELLERRLDNVVFRLGLTNSRPAARQLVAHGNILLNGKKCDIPSVILSANDEVKVLEKIYNSDHFKVMRDDVASVEIPAWLQKSGTGGIVKAMPTRDMIDKTFKEQSIVEYYSK